MVPGERFWIYNKPEPPDALQLVLPPGTCPLEDTEAISSSILSNSVLWFVMVT